MTLVEPRSRVRAAELGVLYDAALAGHGVAWLPDWLVEESLEMGMLVSLLPDLSARTHDIHLLCFSAEILPGRMRIAIAALDTNGMDSRC